MSFAVLTTIRRYFARHQACWKANGLSGIGIAMCTVVLALLWILLPLERKAWRQIRQHFSELYPHINPQAPRFGDGLRWCLQSLFLLSHTPSPDKRTVRWLRRVISIASSTYERVVTPIADRVTHLLLRYSNIVHSVNDKTPSEPKSSWVHSVFVYSLLAVALVLATLCITQPFNIEGQILFLSVMLTLALILTRTKARLTLMLLFVISIVVSSRYLWWRCTSTILADSWISLVLSFLLLFAEIYAFVVMVLGYFQVCWVFERKPYPLPDRRETWPTVDVFVPTYNESLDVIKPTLFACRNLDWPADKLNIYLLDDGSRPAFEAYAKEAGVGYIKREKHNHAKAGNINHAMGITRGEFIVIFDCDHVPSCDFLTSTMGWLVKDEKIALVQTPHHFYSPDPFEKNLHLPRAMPIENELFHDFIQKGNDTWNATMFCGSSAVMRRKALEQVGGIAVETVTEDAHTSLKLNRMGWSSAFISRPVASGLSTETLSAHIGQRIRWARGMVQIFRLDNPLFGKGLTLPQRLCFLNAMVHFFHGLPRLIFLLAPLPYMFANVYVIYATAAAIFAYVLPHMVHTMITNQMLQRGHRYPFLSGVYETVLSWYILLPTTVALFMPHKGKFNVTAKGATIDNKYLDWPICKPYLFLIAVNLIGLGIGFYKALFDPAPEYLTLAINMAWIAYNLMILGATMACAVEETIKHPFPRVPLRTPMRWRRADGNWQCGELTAYSQAEAVFTARNADIAVDDRVEIELEHEETIARVTGSVHAVSADAIEIALSFETLEQERLYNRCTFARRGMWAIAPEGKVDDRLHKGYLLLMRLALYGYRSMIEFLPARLSWLRSGVRWIAGLMPRLPKI